MRVGQRLEPLCVGLRGGLQRQVCAPLRAVQRVQVSRQRGFAPQGLSVQAQHGGVRRLALHCGFKCRFKCRVEGMQVAQHRAVAGP